ncbi:MAG: UDP-N-acetylmuramate dehydrogenase [Puniceicoccales bacterium]|jgi:UDP-N-acetylenolpyruvoylglucosamine reductase|nr:UDP-N-acetylmuramate dehydrogenase [Puniceicoccales bacterium]
MGKNVCMLGICGAGMAPLAIYLVQRGYGVYGWDDYANFTIKDLLTDHGIVFMPDKVLPPNCSSVIRSSAVDERSDAVCQRARETGVEIFRRGEFLAKVCEDRKLVAIMGSHGKTSVSGNCVEILKKNGVVFDYVVGGFFKGNAILPAEYNEKSEWVVAEVDESDGTMENFSPECTIALNYDDDHVDNYGDRGNFLRAFRDIFVRTKSTIFVSEKDKTFTDLASEFGSKYVKIRGLDGRNFQEINRKIAAFCLEKIFGKNFIIPDKITGIRRRNDVMLRTDKFVFLNDYAHHPTEIGALFNYVKSIYADHDLNIVFQPHRLSRTQQYFAEFAKILDKFDRQFVVELYAAFEQPIEGVSSRLVFDRMESRRKRFLTLAGFNSSMHDVYGELGKKKKKQLMLFVGAGNILSHAKKFIDEIAFGEMERHLALSKISFGSFVDLTNAFAIKIPTLARICVEPSTLNELATVLTFCQNFSLAYRVMGNGTKIIPPDGVIDAVVIRFRAEYWKKMQWIDENTLYCSCGLQMKDLHAAAMEKGYVGVEKLVHIPGCVGGSICMNAGAHGQAISDRILFIEAMDQNGITHTIEKGKAGFTYRNMAIPRGYIVIGGIFQFGECADGEYFEAAAREFLNWRRAHQPKGINFGSVFKNGDDFRAGELIDKAGLKGKSVGGAMISDEHANFIINRDHASAKDVEKLIDAARYEVFSKFGKFLQMEVKIMRP